MNRGLDALFSDNFSSEEKSATSKENAVSTISISLIEPNKNQPRTQFDQDKIDALAQSIKENGILQPILVTPLENGGYRIVAGERRWRAARLAGLEEVPAYIKNLSEKQTMKFALIENVQRQDLSPMEEARAYKQLMEVHMMTQQELSEAVGKSRSAIANYLRLLTLAQPVAEMVESGELSVGHAKMLAGISDPKQQEEFAKTCVSKGFSVRQLENSIAGSSKHKGKQNKDSLKKKNPFLREFELNVNSRSAIKTGIKTSENGVTCISLSVGKQINIDEFLSRLAELLTKY